MIALRIEEQKKFTSGLFIGELFDQFLLREADIVTCLDGESLRSREVRLVLAEKRVNFSGRRGAVPMPRQDWPKAKEASIFHSFSAIIGILRSFNRCASARYNSQLE